MALTLPDELWQAIFNEAAPSKPDLIERLPFDALNNASLCHTPPCVTRQDFKTRRDLCAVCSLWRQIALPLLVRDLLITSESHAKTFHHLLADSDLDLAPHVHSLWLVYPSAQISSWQDQQLMLAILHLVHSSLTVISLCHSLQSSTSYAPGPFPSDWQAQYQLGEQQTLDFFPSLKNVYWNTLLNYEDNPNLNAALDFIVCRSSSIQFLLFGCPNPDNVFRRNPHNTGPRPTVLFPSLRTLVLRKQSTFDDAMVQLSDFPLLTSLVIDQNAIRLWPFGPGFSTFSQIIGHQIERLELSGFKAFLSLRNILDSFRNLQEIALPMDKVALFRGDRFPYPSLKRVLLHSDTPFPSRDNQIEYNFAVLRDFGFPGIETIIASGSMAQALPQLDMNGVAIVDESGTPISELHRP